MCCGCGVALVLTTRLSMGANWVLGSEFLRNTVGVAFDDSAHGSRW